ncbi:MAG: hypothetical protein HY231_26385 [Acidobacteria bacterium]|nr:hypothetical protein [Acidobacteriota bacterium]
MRTGSTVNPGQRGSKKLLLQYGKKLVCVRYRYDEKQGKRYKTVELIVEESDWQPKPRALKDSDIVNVKVSLTESALQNKVKSAGGRWNRKQQAWELRYDQAKRLRIERRIIKRQNL